MAEKYNRKGCPKQALLARMARADVIREEVIVAANLWKDLAAAIACTPSKPCMICRDRFYARRYQAEARTKGAAPPPAGSNGLVVKRRRRRTRASVL